MNTLRQICDYLEAAAPPRLAEDWDNVGLLSGDPTAAVARVMTCLTITPAAVDEAIDRQADLIISHHPLPFRAIKRITTEEPVGRMLWALTRAGIAIYSPHTAFDSAPQGINQQLAEMLGLTQIQPLTPCEHDPAIGTGRWGRCATPRTLAELASDLQQGLTETGREPYALRGVAAGSEPVSTVAVACGSAGQFLTQARECGCEVFVTGETTFHTCLEAEAHGIGLVLLGHFASERFAVVKLAERLRTEINGLEKVWASEAECDPIKPLVS